MPSFEDWVVQVFDHPVTDPEWYFRREYDEVPSQLKPEETATYVATLFESPRFLLTRYSEGQIAHGLQFLLFTAASNCSFVIIDELIPVQLRMRVIQSLFFLNKDLFASICSDYCGGPEQSKKRPADFVCFMMWDDGILKLAPDRPEQAMIDKALLSVLQDILRLPSVPCQKSALHGLGHAHYDYPNEVIEIVDKYLAEPTNIRGDLVEYALRAREGSVL